MGRPLKNPAEGARVNVMFRLTGAMRDRVARLAAENGRSMSEELERIVEAHFAGQNQRAMMREVVAEALAEHETKAMDLLRARRAAALEALNLAQPSVRFLGRTDA